MLLDNIYVINLDRSRDRLKKITKNFHDHGIHFTRFAAIEGKKLSKEQIEKNTTLAARTILSNYAIIGCAMSHMQLWKNLLNDNVDYYIIFEDDAIINDQFKQNILEIEKNKDKIDFDILSLHCTTRSPFDKHVLNLTDDLKIIRPSFPLKFTSYIISKKGAGKLLLLINKINYHIDMELACRNLLNKINYFALNKNIVNSDKNIDSTIQHNGHKSILLTIIKKLGFNNLYEVLNTSALTISLNYTISTYFLILVALLIINILYFHNIYLYIFVLIELALYFV